MGSEGMGSQTVLLLWSSADRQQQNRIKLTADHMRHTPVHTIQIHTNWNRLQQVSGRVLRVPLTETTPPPNDQCNANGCSVLLAIKGRHTKGSKKKQKKRKERIYVNVQCQPACSNKRGHRSVVRVRSLLQKWKKEREKERESERERERMHHWTALSTVKKKGCSSTSLNKEENLRWH